MNIEKGFFSFLFLPSSGDQVWQPPSPPAPFLLKKKVTLNFLKIPFGDNWGSIMFKVLFHVKNKKKLDMLQSVKYHFKRNHIYNSLLGKTKT